MDLETLESLSERVSEPRAVESPAVAESSDASTDAAGGTATQALAAADDGLVVEATIDMAAMDVPAVDLATAATDEVGTADTASDDAGASVARDLDAILGDAGDGDAGPELEGLDAIVESLLLASGGPVPLARLVEALDGPSRTEVAAALAVLAARYERDNRGLRLIEVAGAFQLRTAPQHGPFVRRLLGGRPPRLSRPMLETLAIVAYRQPCTRPEIEAIRGVDCDAVLSKLLERRLVRMLGRKEAPGRPVLYGTTRDFLEVFGLPDLRALPPLRDLGDGIELLMAQDLQVGPNGVQETAPAAPAEPDAVVAENLSQPSGDAADEPTCEPTDDAPADDTPIRDALMLAATHVEAADDDQYDDESEAEAERYGD